MEFTPFTIISNSIDRTLEHEGIAIIEIKINYPEIVGNTSRAAKRINRFYKGSTEAYLKSIKTHLFPVGIATYNECLAASREFKPFEIKLSYKVTENSPLCLSICRTLKEKTGTLPPYPVLFGDTWNVKKGWPLDLHDFRSGEKRRCFKKKIIENCTETASEQAKKHALEYKSTYPKLIKRHFNCENFFIKDGKITVFYPTDTIAEKHEGIIEFAFDNCLQKDSHHEM